MRHVPLCLLSALALGSAIQAQRLATYVPAGALIAELQPPTPLFPGPVPPGLVYPQVPAMPLMPAPAGDSTFNNLVGYHWVTNGAIMAAQPTPMFPPLGPVPAAFPIPPAVLAAIGGGPVTAIALDAVGGIMWLAGAPGIVIGVAPVPAMPVMVPPFPIPLLAPPCTGLDWDSATGSLYAVNGLGVTYNFTPAGLPLAPPLVPPVVLPGMAGDVAIDRTLRLNAFGLRPLYVTAGAMVLDVRELLPIMFPTGPAPAQGLAFINHPATNMPGGPCICPGTPYPAGGPTTTSVMTNLNAAWGVTVTGLPPGFPVIFGFDLAGFLPGFPVINPPVGCGLGLTLTGSTLFFSGAADPFGVATLAVPLTPPAFLLGTGPFYNQNATLCAADPTFGLVLTPVQSVYACAP